MNKVFLKAYVEKIAENKYRAIASTDAVDRYGDIVDQNGWQLDNYMKNPVMLWAHDSSQLPVAKCTGIDRSQVGKMVVEFEFNSAAGSPLAPYVKNSYDNGFLNALSVGFLSGERKGAVITSAELLEISFVPVPANQEALRLAMSKGLDLGGIEKDLQIDAKGEVSAELAAEEAAEDKWKKWEEVIEVLNALWTVYFDPNTPVEDFSKLLNESIDLLQSVANNDGSEDDEDEKSFKEALTKFIGGRTIKAGRTISSKNAKVLQKAMDHMRDCMKVMSDMSKGHDENSAALEAMLASASSDEGSGKSASNGAQDESILILGKEDVAMLRTMLRATDRQNEASLTLVNRFLATKEKK